MQHTASGYLVGAMWLVGCVAPGAKAPEDGGFAGQGGCTSMCPEPDAGSTADAAIDRDALIEDAATDRDAWIEDAAVSGADADVDASITSDAGPVACNVDYATGPSHCTVSETMARCTHVEHTIGGRIVYSQVPMGTAPVDGWPAVVVYQGSGYGPTVTWAGDSTMPFGGLNQVKLQAMLLDNGFAVIAPSADGTAWNTNFPGYETSSDSRFIPILIDEIDKGTFGAIDMTRLYATGMSSGGYMTSRMAVSYPGIFRALAINSGSYATCSNVLCAIPNPLPDGHPPTLFLHGQNDIPVPVATAQAYKAQLDSQGVETAMVIDPLVVHQWLKVAPVEVTCWFVTH